ncbi:MAG: hypothetical protein WC314_16395 [Vulcanimicrobiota bacterium]
MKIFHLAKTAALALALATTLAGCSGNGSTSPATPQAVGTYTGQDLPEVVEELEGTPLYTGSTELTGLAQAQGATYLLIAPQDPLKALLVVEEGTTAEQVAQRQSAPVKLAGTRGTLDAQPLIEHVKANYELDLKTDEQGRIIVLNVPNAAAAPQSTATPLNGSTPAVE